jgi:AraC family transcriptional regulator
MSQIHMLSKARRVPFFDAADLNSAHHPWAGFTFEEAQGHTEPLPCHAWPKTTLLFVTGGQSDLHWRHRGTSRVDSCQAGTVSIMRRDVEIQSAAANRPLRMMVTQLDNSKLQHIAPDYVHTIEKSLEPAQVANDRRLATLLSAMCQEVREGCPSGRLYGESVSLTLLAYLSGAYSSPHTSESRAHYLTPGQKRSVLDYIRSNAASNVTVSELATLVQMSPSHFTRVFKATFGISPYRFVMQERIEEARNMLEGTKLSSSQISCALGFASQSHFVKVFRQFAGVTPKQFRAGF